MEVFSNIIMDSHATNLGKNIFEQNKQMLVEKLLSSAKNTFLEELLRTILNWCMVSLFILAAFVLEIDIVLGKIVISNSKFTFIIIFSIIFSIPMHSRLFQNRKIIRDIDSKRNEKIHLDFIYDSIFQIYSKFLPTTSIENRETSPISLDYPFQKVLKTRYSVLITLDIVAGILILIFLGTTFFPLVMGLTCFLSAFFHIVQYFQFKQWITIWPDLIHWKSDLSQYETVECDVSIQSLEDDFKKLEQKNYEELM